MEVNKRCTNFCQQLRICNESFIKTYQQSVPPGQNPLGCFSQRKTKQQFVFLMLFEHKEARVFIFRLSKIIHLGVRKACKIFKECFISCRHPRRNRIVQPLFAEYFDVKCLNCQDHSVSAEESSWEWFDLFSNLGWGQWQAGAALFTWSRAAELRCGQKQKRRWCGIFLVE